MSHGYDRRGADFGYDYDQGRRNEYGQPLGDRTPGKRTITGMIFRSAAGAARAAEGVAEIAARGFAGTSQEVPHRTEMERAFGRSFADVRAFTDSPARESARALHAHAYTVGNDIAFATESPDQRLVAHELAHVVQQRGASGAVAAKAEVSEPGDPLEREADEAAAAVVAGRPVSALRAAPTMVSRKDAAAAGAATDPEDARFMLDTFVYYVGCFVAGIEPQVQDQGSYSANAVLAPVLTVGRLLRAHRPEQSSRALGEWSRSRAVIANAIDQYAKADGHESKALSDARQALDQLDTLVASQRAEEAVVAGANDQKFESPDEGFYQTQAAALRLAIQRAFEYHRRALDAAGRMASDKVNNTYIPNHDNKSGSPVGTAERAGEQYREGVGGALALLRAANSVLNAVKLDEGLRRARNEGFFKTAPNLAAFFSESLKAVRDVCTGTTSILASVSSPARAASLKAIGDRFRVLTTITGAIEVIGNAIKLVDAVDKGDEKGIGEAVHGILQGGWAIFANALRLGPGVTGGVALTLYLWHQAYVMMGQLGGILQDIRAGAGRNAIKRVVDTAAGVAERGTFMSAALMEMLNSVDMQMDSETLQEKYQAAVERIAREESGKIRAGLASMRAMFHSRDTSDIGGYPKLISDFPVDALDTAVGLDDPFLLGDHCNRIFIALDALGRRAASKNNSDVWTTA